MLERYWTNKIKLGAVLVVYGVSVLLLDMLGTGELATLAVPLLLISTAPFFERKYGLRLFSKMLLPGILICGSSALAYSSLNWGNTPSVGFACTAFLLFAAAWVFAIYRALSSPA